MKKLFNKNFWIILLCDICLIIAAYWLSYLFRFEFRIPHNNYINFHNTLLPILIIKTATFFYFGLYRGMYRYTSISDLLNIIKASLVSSAVIALGLLTIHRFEGFARSVYFIDGMLTVCFIGGFRLSMRLIISKTKRDAQKKYAYNPQKSLLIIGAGDAGEKILREIKENTNLHYKVLGFLDDDKKKHNKYIHNVKILGEINKINTVIDQMHKNLDEILIALPSVNGERMHEIISLCQGTMAKCRTIPGIGELINGRVTASAIRDVSYEDLLGREPIRLNLQQIGSYLTGKSVLITGAGGSIGSELCRQVSIFKPEQLIIFDRAESRLYDLEMELRQIFPQQKIVPVLGSITCQKSVERVFSFWKPHVVFHAAAYKHVPIMEAQPWEAIYNNIIGTKHVLDATINEKCEKFVLVSTDKAVRPTNVMGATKRITEKYLIQRNEESNGTKAMAVRFGNVVGSAGSVIPLFKKQIACGGPVTVTHPSVIRYFMTISEACQLILQAGAIGQKGSIYILKMGKPVKIVDVARDLIRLSGFEPDKDIKIKFTGLRPGEKLYEELITSEEGIVPTDHEKLMVLKPGINNNGSPIKSREDFDKIINDLAKLGNKYDKDGIKKKIKEIVPEYSLYCSEKDGILKA
ncbi:MAG: polysaccharide biosynthesis protein [bacterium]